VPGHECLCIPSPGYCPGEPETVDREPFWAWPYACNRCSALQTPQRMWRWWWTWTAASCTASCSAGANYGYGQVRGQPCHSFLRRCINCRCRCSALVQGAEGNRFSCSTVQCPLRARAPPHAARGRTRALKNGRHLPDAAPEVFARDPDAEGSSESRPARWRGYWLRLVHLRVPSTCAHGCGGGAYGRGVASSLV
jgi:hypothetical protein